MMIKIRTRESGIIDVRAAPTPWPGLVVAEVPPDTPNVGANRFPVIHLRSGIGLGNFGDPELALAAAIEYGEVLDWTCSGDEAARAIKQPDIAWRMNAINHRYHRSRQNNAPTPNDLRDLPS